MDSSLDFVFSFISSHLFPTKNFNKITKFPRLSKKLYVQGCKRTTNLKLGDPVSFSINLEYIQGVKPSEKKNGYVLPKSEMELSHRLRVINSDEIQYVVRPARSPRERSLLREGF